jgi:hypothetical protein
MLTPRSVLRPVARPDGSPAARCLGALLALVVGLSGGCEATRGAPAMACSSSAQCPADGLWTCDLAARACVRCVGACPQVVTDASSGGGDAVDAGAGADADAETDAGAETDSGADTNAGAETDAGADAETDTGAETDGDASPEVLGDVDEPSASCAGRCGVYDASASCSCDAFCVDFGDCCADYESLCVGADTTSDAGADAGALPDAASATGT